MDALIGAASAAPEEARALLVLDQLPGVGPRSVRAAVDGFGSAVAALAAPRARLAALLGREAAAAAGDPEVHRVVDRGLAEAERLAIAVVSWSAPTYPGRLRRLADPPPVLFLRGRVEWVDAGGVAVVGARRCTGRGKDVARRLGRALGRSGVPVVSGMALGVDAQAHRGALDAGGPTVAVVGRGADAAYPAAHARLFDDLVTDGLVVSEFLPGTLPRPHHFPRRNRIMAALADVVVVVEAGRRSGALITVEHALDLGRDVWSVPGPIDAPTCAGSNLLLAEGALPLVSIEGFLHRITGGGVWVPGRSSAGDVDGRVWDGRGQGELWGRRGTAGGAVAAASKSASPDTPGASRGDPPRGDAERRILGTLVGGPLHVDQLAVRAGVDVPLALSVLVQLELEGVVEQLPGFHFRAA